VRCSILALAMKVTRALLALVPIGLLAGCGAAAAPPRAPVRITIASPSDGTRLTQSTVTLSGTVSPSVPAVLVGGRRVAVVSGAFNAEVALAPGANVVDVLAGSARAAAAMTAVRVYRQVTIAVPDVVGASPSEASAQLTASGLKSQTSSAGSGFDFLLPLSVQVCATHPSPGTQVQPGSTIELLTGKVC
jgi:hypothetical protein